MAKQNLYQCRQCGWSIEVSEGESGFLMESFMASYLCKDCKQIFAKHYALGTVFEGLEVCPKCKGKNTKEWKPAYGCPLCGGELEDKGLSCLMD